MVVAATVLDAPTRPRGYALPVHRRSRRHVFSWYATADIMVMKTAVENNGLGHDDVSHAVHRTDSTVAT